MTPSLLEPSAALEVLDAGLRWAGFLGYTLLVGTSAFVGLCWPAGSRVVGVRRLAWGGWVLSTLAVLGAALVHGPYVAALPLASALDPDVFTATLAGRPGTGLLFRAALLVLAAPLLLVLLAPAPARPGGRRWVPTAGVLVLGSLLAATWSATGHSGSGSGAWLALPADAAHLVAMAVWAGGLTTLFVGLRHEQGLLSVRSAAARFSPVALTAVAVLVLTGSYQTWRQVGTLPALAGTDYGRTLLLKTVTVLGMVALGAASRAWVRQERAGDPSDVRGLRRSVTAEAALAAVVLALSSVLVGLEPARSAVDAAASRPGAQPGTHPGAETSRHAHAGRPHGGPLRD